MDFKIEIGFEQLVTLVKQLPNEKLAKLTAALKKETKANKKRPTAVNFQSLLLAGPQMSKEQFETFRANRVQFSQWREK